MRSHASSLAQLLTTAAILLGGQLAVAGPFPGWDYRTRIQLDNSTGATNLADFPVLITLDANNFDFHKAKTDGSDLRFADANGTALSFEVEKWDAAAGQAAVWVKVPQLDLGSSTGYINMYVGNTAAIDAQDAPGVWSNGYAGVWHLGTSLIDSTGNGNNGTASGTAGVVAGVAGDARYFNLGSISTPGTSNGTLDAGNNISVSYWMNGAAADQPGGFTRVLAKNNDSVGGWEYQRGGADASQSMRIDTSGGTNNQVRQVTTSGFDGNWHFIGNTLASGAEKGYLDGNAPNSGTYNQAGGFGNMLPLVIGARSAGSTSFRGMVDEVRVSDVVRSDAWMNAEYRSQSGQLASLGPTAFVSGLVAQYSHEDAGNRLLDTSGNGRDITVNHGVTFVAPTDPQGFDAGLGTTVGSYVRSQTDYLDVPASVLDAGAGGIDATQGFTFTALVYNDGLSNDFRTILSSNRFRFQRSTDGVFRLDVNNPPGGNNYFTTGSGVVQNNTWYLAVLQYDATSNQGAAYLLPSTAVVTSPTFSFSPTSALTDLTVFRLGSDGRSLIGGADSWGGLIDNAQFFQGALTKGQIRDVLNTYTGRTGPVGLVAQYSHENPANRLADDTGHGLTATNAGGVTFAAPASPGDFSAALGSTAGQYPYSGNGYLTVPELYTSGDDFTFMALVRVGDDNAFHTVLGSNRFRLQYQPGTLGDGAGVLGLQVNGAGEIGAAASTANLFPMQQWQWVAMTYNATTKQIQAYLQPDSPVFFSPVMTQTANDGSGVVGLNDMTRFQIGYNGLSGIGGGDAFAGQIDAVRFYDQAFTPAQIQQLFQQYRAVAPGPVGLVAQYTHENAANRLADDTGHFVGLTNQGNVTFVDSSTTNPGVFAPGLGDTVGQYSGGNRLDVRPYTTDGDGFTFAGLVRVTDENAFHTILGSDRFRFQYYPTGTVGDGYGALNLETNSPGVSGSTHTADMSFPIDDWRFVALTYDATTKQIQAYLQDGSPVFAGAALVQTANGADGWSNMTRFQIGYNGLSGIGGGDGFKGQMDGLRFYDQALTPLQLRDLFRTLTGRSPGPLGLVAKYDHENAANRLQDDTGNGLNATNGGAVTFVAPTSPGPFDLGSAAGQYNGAGGSYLDVPNVHTPGDDFTFIAMVRKDAAAGGHQTILDTNRFRLQFRGTSTDAGVLRLDVDGAGASGPGETAVDGFPVEEWQFVALTYDASTKQIQAWLQDGSPVFLGADMTRVALGALGIDDISQFRVGMKGYNHVGGAGADPFRGQIDGIRFYDTLLSKRELRDVFRTYNPLPGGAVGLVAQYRHEGPNPLADDTGHGVTAVAHGSVSFVAPPAEGMFHVGQVVGQYPRADDSYLSFPEFYTEGDDFTFTALVRKSGDESGGHQTILASDLFRFQYRDTGGESNGAGTLRLDVAGAGTGESGDDTFLTEEWYFVAMRYNAQTGDIDAFLDDGTGGLTAPAFSMTGVNLDGMVNFRVGADGLSGIGSPDAFGGWIDSIQFYDRFLSNGELQQLYQSYVPEPASLVLLLLGLGAAPLVLRRRGRRAAG